MVKLSVITVCFNEKTLKELVKVLLSKRIKTLSGL